MPCERLPLNVFSDSKDLAVAVAHRVATLIRSNNFQGRKTVLGLPTGNSPINVYRELIRMHEEEQLDFTNVVTFNLDEYYGVPASSMHSYRTFMNENFFRHVNIKMENTHILSGEVPREQVRSHCVAFEHMIDDHGGLDLTMLGIGRTGHIAFNEPERNVVNTKTRLVSLDTTTISDAASDFFGRSNVPREALTMGVATILKSREIILMATGEAKAGILKKTIEEPTTDDVPASYLQTHPNCAFYIDIGAAERLIRTVTPWKVFRDFDVTKSTRNMVLACQALCRKTKKPLFSLRREDFEEERLMIRDADAITREVYSLLMNEKLNEDKVVPGKGERVIVFSPHPDDDVISMGGMLHKMHRRGCDISVAYCVNGSVSVPSYDVKRFLRFMQLALPVFGLEDAAGSLSNQMDKVFSMLKVSPNPALVQQLKGSIRRAEAENALDMFGMRGSEQGIFLNLPFYETGEVRKNPYTEKDVAIVAKLLNDEKPAHIFVAGDLTDPNGTHRQCYAVIRDALRCYNHGKVKVWTYRGAWQEYSIPDADVIITMSASELSQKIDAIYRHESQKDRAMYPGADQREFWMRARDRNVAFANDLAEMGLPHFHAAEAFRCFDSDLPSL
jgi:glucosamine-6-phosphate deaminase